MPFPTTLATRGKSLKRIGDYEFVRELGSGNYGSYWLARTPIRLNVADEFCAVKVLGTHASGDAFQRMVNELKLFASAGSPHLVRLLDAGHQDGTLFYAAEYHPVGSLADCAERMSAIDIVRAVADAARGAHALHELGVAHRDIKPANVLIVRLGDEPEPPSSEPVAVLSDLGLAQRLSRVRRSPGWARSARWPIWNPMWPAGCPPDVPPISGGSRRACNGR